MGELAWTTYDGANASYLSELLAEEQGVELSRQSVPRILRALLASVRRGRATDPATATAPTGWVGPPRGGLARIVQSVEMSLPRHRA